MCDKGESDSCDGCVEAGETHCKSCEFRQIGTTASEESESSNE